MKKGILITSYTIVLVCLFAMAESNNIQEQKRTIEPLSTQEDAVALLNKLIQYNDLFSVKIAHRLLPAKVKLWQQRGTFKFPPQITWDLFKKDIHKFGSFLHTLLNKDARGEYYHLDALRKNHHLYKALERMDQKLTLIKTSNQAETPQKVEGRIQPLIALYANGLYNQKLLTMMTNFFKKFEIQAKKMREEAERAQKVAEQRSPAYDIDAFDFEFNAGESDFGDLFSDKDDFDFDSPD